MKKLNISVQDAIDLIKDARSTVCPNAGFMRQLKKFYYTKLHPELAHEFNQEGTTTSGATATQGTATSAAAATPSQDEPPPQASATQPEPSAPEPTPLPNCKYYTCRFCSTRMFDETDLVPHQPGKHQFQHHKRSVCILLRVASQVTTSNRDKNNTEVSCTSYFLDERPWMGDISELEGRIKCPKCSKVVGSWKWDGTQCSCGYAAKFILWLLCKSSSSVVCEVPGVRQLFKFRKQEWTKDYLQDNSQWLQACLQPKMR